MATTFTIGHISDLHFSSGVPTTHPDHKHSVPHVRGLAEALQTDQYDRLIISGDLSHRGDEKSLRLAHQWITSKTDVGDGVTCGLSITDPTRYAVVPGNHDAWNAGSDQRLLTRWQRSLAHFDAAFPDHHMADRGVWYDWLESNGHGVLLVYLDSCFLGAPGTPDDPFDPFGKPARGDLSVEQSERLIEYYDLGTMGKLQHPRENRYIDAATFNESLKILVMHHYLFKPRKRVPPLMHLHEARKAFHNVAPADFDLLLCGHSHIADAYTTTYGDEFDHRARTRYIMNLFRRELGIHSLPTQYIIDGRLVSKALSLIMNVALRAARRVLPSAYATTPTDALLTLLRRGLEEPEVFEAEIAKYRRVHDDRNAEITLEELRFIKGLVKNRFSKPERQRLEALAQQIQKDAKNIRSRSFVQVMNGSACKATTKRKRCFNVYTIEKLTKGWMVHTDEYPWDPENANFAGPPRKRHYSFRAA